MEELNRTPSTRWIIWVNFLPPMEELNSFRQRREPFRIRLSTSYGGTELMAGPGCGCGLRLSTSYGGTEPFVNPWPGAYLGNFLPPMEELN